MKQANTALSQLGKKQRQDLMISTQYSRNLNESIKRRIIPNRFENQSVIDQGYAHAADRNNQKSNTFLPFVN